MPRENNKPPNSLIDTEELAVLSRELKYGLERFVDFEQKIHVYRRETLSQFIVLTTDPEQYDTVRTILDLLEELSGRSRTFCH